MESEPLWSMWKLLFIKFLYRYFETPLTFLRSWKSSFTLSCLLGFTVNLLISKGLEGMMGKEESKESMKAFCMASDRGLRRAGSFSSLSKRGRIFSVAFCREGEKSEDQVSLLAMFFLTVGEEEEGGGGRVLEDMSRQRRK